MARSVCIRKRLVRHHSARALEGHGMRYSTPITGIFLAVMLAVCLPAQGHAQSRKIKLRPADIYTNETSHFQFPPTVADFKRELTFTQFDREGRDIGVGYNDLV